MQRLSLFLLVLLLGACSQVPTVPEGDVQRLWQQHHARIAALSKWQIQGRVGVYTEDEAWPGDIIWKQNGMQYDMRVIAPLGAGTLHIYTHDQGVMLEHSSESSALYTEDPEAYIREAFGWQIPVNHLRFWMSGIPSPNSGHNKILDLDEQGRLLNLVQSGWKIHYARYKTVGDYQLPAKVLLEQDGMSVKIVIRQWQI